MTYVSSTAVRGDYNQNGIVDAADYTVWRDRLGGTSLPNEGSTPGTVNQADYDFWRSRFGNVSGSGSLAAGVPEPASVILLVAVGALVGLGRRWG